MPSVNPSNIVQNRVAPVKGHYQVSFRHPRIGKSLKMASLFSKKTTSCRDTASPDTAMDQRDVNPPLFLHLAL